MEGGSKKKGSGRNEEIEEEMGSERSLVTSIANFQGTLSGKADRPQS
jgi:hypothetical protein